VFVRRDKKRNERGKRTTRETLESRRCLKPNEVTVRKRSKSRTPSEKILDGVREMASRCCCAVEDEAGATYGM